MDHQKCRKCVGHHSALTDCPYVDTELVNGKLQTDKASGSGPGAIKRSEANFQKYDQGFTIKISYLPETTIKMHVEKLVKPFGLIHKVYVGRDEVAGVSKVFSYVHFTAKGNAAKAVAGLNGHSYNQCILKVELSKNVSERKGFVPLSQRDGSAPASRNHDDAFPIRVSNLPENMTDRDLEKLVRPFGAIRKMYLARDKVTGVCKGFAYIDYKFKTNADKAVGQLNGSSYKQCILKVVLSKQRSEKNKPIPPRDGANEQGGSTTHSPKGYDQLFTIKVSNLPESMTKPILESLVKPYGPIQKMYLSKDKKTKLCKGISYIHFKAKSDAAKAVAKLNGQTYEQCVLKVDMVEPLARGHDSQQVGADVQAQSTDMLLGIVQQFNDHRIEIREETVAPQVTDEKK